MKSTFSLLLSSILLSSSLTLAAPTQDAQLVFGSTKSSTRDPDFVDILDSQSFKNKLEELLHDAESVSSNLVSESYNKAADLSNEAEVEALILAASLEDKAMNILPVPQNFQSGQNKLKSPSKNDISFSDTPIWGAFKSMNIMDAPTPPGGGWVWSSCGQSSDAVQVQDIRVSPDPPRPGQNLTVHAKGIVNSKIENGTYADVSVKLGLIKLLTRRFDVCEEAKKNDAEVQCPVEPGPYEIEQTVALPREIPPAKFNVHVTGGTQDDENLLCLDLSINFMHRG